MNPLFYFLVALTAVLAATADAGGPAVLDVDGDPIFHGSYYVLPLFVGPAGGGLTLIPRGGKQCPLYVSQEPEESDWGIPVKFSNWSPKVPFVPESENLNINMDVAATICVQSTYWWVDADKVSRTWFIAAGPKPEQDSSKSFFQIKKTGSDVFTGYKIAFCPSDNCFDVGIFVDKHGVRRLTLSSRPLPVVFVKATGTGTLTKTMPII